MSKFRLTVGYFAIVTIIWIVFVVLAFGVTILVFPETWQRVVGKSFFVIVYLAGLSLIVPIDRWVGERFRKLEKMND